MLADIHGLAVVYKRKVDSSAAQAGAHSAPTDTEGAPQGLSGQEGGALGVPTDTATPFVQLQLDLQKHGPLLDAFWLPPLQQQQQEAGGGAAEDTKTEGGCFFVTVQQRRVAVWSVPLLRILAITLRREPQAEPLEVRSCFTCAHACVLLLLALLLRCSKQT